MIDSPPDFECTWESAKVPIQASKFLDDLVTNSFCALTSYHLLSSQSCPAMLVFLSLSALSPILGPYLWSSLHYLTVTWPGESQIKYNFLARLFQWHNSKLVHSFIFLHFIVYFLISLPQSVIVYLLWVCIFCNHICIVIVCLSSVSPIALKFLWGIIMYTCSL